MRLTSVHDMPVTLATILQMRTWTRSVDGIDEMYDAGAWRAMSADERVIINKIDGQVNKVRYFRLHVSNALVSKLFFSV